MVYGLKYYYRLPGMNKKAIALPSLKQDTKLPVILNRSELKELFSAPSLLKQRIVLTLWVEDLQEATLPIKHYHIIFTAPHCLNEFCLWDKRMHYNVLCSIVWTTLHSFGYTHYGVETGAVAVLHSWVQNLYS